MKVITPEKIIEVSPVKYEASSDKELSIFLAGTIDNGNSANWQKFVIDKLSNCNLPNLTVYNPRRDEWHTNANEEELFEQIEWEQIYLEKCDLIVMVLRETSMSPISLMELGEFCRDQKMIVFCPKRFYRYGNVKYMCDAFGIKLIESDSCTDVVIEILDNLNVK